MTRDLFHPDDEDVCNASEGHCDCGPCTWHREYASTHCSMCGGELLDSDITCVHRTCLPVSVEVALYGSSQRAA